jgi:hypothetical protein
MFCYIFNFFMKLFGFYNEDEDEDLYSIIMSVDENEEF